MSVLYSLIMNRIARINAPDTCSAGAAKTTTATDYVIATGAAGVAAASAGAAINSAVLGSPLAFVYHTGVTLVAGAYSVSTFLSGDSDESTDSKSASDKSSASTDASAPAAA